MQISLRVKTGILLLTILAVTSIITLATFRVNRLQKDYALIINLAGRQRMLSQKMSKEIMEIFREKEGKGSGGDYRESLDKTMDTFDRTLNALTNGGETLGPGGEKVTLPKASHPDILEKLKGSSELWNEFHKNIEIVIKPETAVDSEDLIKGMTFIETNNTALLTAMNDVTEIYQREADGVVALLEKVQIWALMITVGGMIIGFYLIEAVIIRPLSIIAKNLRAVADGELTGEITIRNCDEIGNMAATVNQMTANLRGMITDITGTSSNVASASEQVASATEELTAGAEMQSTAVDRTSVSIEEMNASIREMAENTSHLSHTAMEAATSTSEIAASIDEVAKIAEDLSSTVEEVSSSIVEMAASVKEIAGHASQLSSSTSDTAAAVSQINTYIKEVEGNLNYSAQLAEGTTNDAEAGREAVRKTIDGMKKIKETVSETAVVVKNLGSRSESIGEILNVINAVAEQTNLLALNAAIIAAQAGEHGKGFSVVADEIKDLAERTTSSTREIETLIKAVQNEAANAVKSMEIGGRSVDAGFDLSQKAGEALDKILVGANSSKEMVKVIANASQEQLKGSQQVKEAMDKITEMIRKVYTAIEDQERGSAHIARAAERMRDGASQVKKATNEQSQNGQHISKAIENISGMVNSINKGTQEQAKGSQEIVKAMMEIKGIIEQNIDGLMKLSEVTEIMSAQTDILENAVKKFNT